MDISLQEPPFKSESQKNSTDATTQRLPCRPHISNIPSSTCALSHSHIPVYSAAVTALAIQVLAPSPKSQQSRSPLTVNAQLAVPNHLLNLTLLLQIIQRFPCKAAVDLQSVHERGDCDETVGLDVFVEFVRGGFVEDDGVVGLVLDCFPEKVESARDFRRCAW